MRLFNEKSNQQIYPQVALQLKEKDFYYFLNPDACEDLLCLWLYAQYGYICIPSTKKKSTELYECVLVDPKTGKKIYAQVKKGNIDLATSDFIKLDGDVWLFTTEGKIIGNDKPNIFKANPEEIYKFALSQEAKNILPKSITRWIEYLSKKG